MSNKHGDYIWYELLSPDVDGAQKFYGNVVGWTFGGQGTDYVHINAVDSDNGRETGIGGMIQLTDSMKAGGAHPVWLGYIGVDDVDQCVQRITHAGGKILMAVWDIPNVGRIALVTDPQGVPFYIMRGASNETSLAFSADKPRPGHCAWNELTTTDPADAWRFYGELFGWEKDSEMDMGELGAYEFIRHGATIGAIMRKPAGMPVPMWSYYFRVPDINRAAGAITANGGQVLYGPEEVPGGDFIITGMDPQGTVFALVGVQDKTMLN